MRFRMLSTSVLLFSLTACAAPLPPPAPPTPVAESYVRDELFFGMRKPDATLVTEAEWQAFVDSVVTPRFPEGLTVLTGYGQWQPESGPLVREPSKVLILIHRGSPDAERRIREIADIYCDRFDQESVTRVRDRVEAEFLDGTREGLDDGVSSWSAYPRRELRMRKTQVCLSVPASDARLSKVLPRLRVQIPGVRVGTPLVKRFRESLSSCPSTAASRALRVRGRGRHTAVHGRREGCAGDRKGT